MDIAGWWAALGLAIVATELASLLTGGAGELRRKDLGKKSMERAYVHVAPLLGGALGKGRAVHALLYLPAVSLLGLALALSGAVCLTVFPKYWSPTENPELYHVFNTPYYVGLAAAYVSTVFMLGHYFYARYRASTPKKPWA